MSEAWPDNLVAVAEVLGPQGNRGEIKAVPLTDRPERFAELRTVTAWKDGVQRRLTLESWRAWRDFVILGFAELTGIDDAEAIRGAMICIDAAERAVLPEGRYYHDDLVGLLAVTVTGRPLGRVTSVMTTKAHDVLVVADPDGRELLLPAVRAVIARVDLEAGTLLVNPLPGLLEQ